MTKNNEKQRDVNNLVLQKALVAGLVAGTFGTIFWMIIHYFNLIEVNPFIIWERLFADKDLFTLWYMDIIGILLNGIVSIGIAIFYFLLFKKFHHWSVGVLYGVIIWAITYLFFPIILFDYNPFQGQPLETHTGFLCFMILYGVFIGYTISFDYESLHQDLKE